MPATNITEEHRTALEALTSGEYDKFALFSCFLNGQPAAAIVAVTAHLPDDKDGESEFHIKPLFVSIVDGLVGALHKGGNIPRRMTACRRDRAKKRRPEGPNRESGLRACHAAAGSDRVRICQQEGALP